MTKSRVLIPVVLIFIVSLAVIPRFLSNCDVINGWGEGMVQSCTCFGIKVTVENNLPADGQLRNVCMGISSVSNLTPTPSMSPSAGAPTGAGTPSVNWKAYSFKEVGLSFSAPRDLTVTSDHSDANAFTLTVQKGQYPNPDYYQLYGTYNLAAGQVVVADLKRDLEPTSVHEDKVSGFVAVSGQMKGDRNRFVTYIITNRGLLTLATSQPTESNRMLTDAIVKTLRVE